MALIDFITPIQFGAISLLRQQCERVGIRRPLIVTDRGVKAAGLVMLNLPTGGVDYHVLFGSRKRSSYGPREQGRYAAEFYTAVKTAYTAA